MKYQKDLGGGWTTRVHLPCLSALGAQVTPLRSLHPQFLPGEKKGRSKSFRYRSICHNRVVTSHLRSLVPKPGQARVRVPFQGLRPTSLCSVVTAGAGAAGPWGWGSFYP